ncbi:MAG: hypothetical protein ACP5KV_07695 [Candidatus Methanomethylicaceae archaeon]
MPSTPIQSNGIFGELAGLAAGIGTMAIGAALMFDDVKDFGLDGSERDPPMPHHWLIGALILASGVAGTCMLGIDFLRKYYLGLRNS